MLSIVIPAYNEALRLPAYLAEIREYARRWPAYEVIVVDDGSTDGLEALLSTWAGQWPQLRVVRHSQNLGKGAAVRTGMLAAGGDPILFTDADGAAPIENEGRLRRALDAGASMACGSRLVCGEGVVRSRRFCRSWAGWAFSLAARWLLDVDVSDTQCGFKMFRREAARQLAELSSETGFAFDVEVLALAHELGCVTAEVAIDWHDVPAGKVRLLRDGASMLLALWRIRRRLAKTRRRGEWSHLTRHDDLREIRCPAHRNSGVAV